MYQYFVGLDVHKQVIAYCIKAADGTIINEGCIKALRFDIDEWVRTIPGPWRGGFENGTSMENGRGRDNHR